MIFFCKLKVSTSRVFQGFIEEKVDKGYFF